MDTTEARNRLEELVRERQLLYERLDQIKLEANYLVQKITNSQIIHNGKD